MASIEIEREIDYFANNSHVKGRSFQYHHNAIKDYKYYDRLWREVLKQIEVDKYANCFKD